MARKTSATLLLLALWALGAVAQRQAGARPGEGAAPDIDISEEAGCGPGPYLKPNMPDCVMDKMMGSNGTLTFGFSIDPKAVKKHAVLLTLRSVGGAAVMRVLPPGMGMFSGRVVYFNDAVTESILRIPAVDLEGGDYTVVVQGMGGATQKLLLYLRVQTPPAGVMLAPKEKAALQSIWRSCCPVTKGLEAPDICSSFLPNVFKATKPEEDLCSMMGFVCNSKGQLEKIDFSNAGLKCPKFPAEFGRFPALESLLLRFNSFNEDTFENVADVLSTAPNLRRLMMGNTNITGRIPCRLFEEHEMKTVMFSVNKLEGDLPDCVLQSSSLEELYMSRLPLTGSLPDTIPEDSNLIVWYAINRDPITNRPAGPGFSGKLPRSIANAKRLAFVELSGHQLTGGVPTLPESIRMLEVQNNQMDGGIASPLPNSLIYFDVSNNSLVGPMPDFSGAQNLTLIDLSQNQLTGSIPSSFGAAGDKVVYMDMSRNRIGGDIGASAAWDRLPSLQYLFMQGNELTGSVPASLAANRKLVALNMAFNRLDGNLDAFAAAIEPGRKTSPQQSSSTSPSTTGHRKLAAFGASRRPAATAAAAAADPVGSSLALGKKLLGTREDWSILQPGQAVQQYFTMDTQAIEAVATGQALAAGRRLMQAVTSTPAAGGATTSTVSRPPVTPVNTGPTTTLNPEPVGQDEQPVPEEPDTPTTTGTGSTTTPTTTATISPTTTTSRPTTTSPTTTSPTTSTSTTADEPPPEEDTTADEPVEPTPPTSSTTSPATTTPTTTPSSSSSGPKTGPTSSAVPVNPAGPPRGRPMPDMAFIAPPSRSQLAGNSFLYLNLSNNDFEGAIPEGMGNLEMFRSPANSTDPFDMYVFSRGGPDRTLDLTYNKLYGEFPRFLVTQAADLSDSCLCSTNFTVSAGNQLYCPTKASLEGVKVTPNLLDTFKQANYTCLLPKQKEPVTLEKYLSDPDMYITSVPSQQDLAAPEPRPVSIDGTDRGYGSTRGSSSSRSSGGKSGMGPGEIAGLVIGLLAGLGILGALAYFVGYKKLYQTHKATSYKRNVIPEGPMLDGAGAYPAAAYGGGAGGATNGSSFNPDAMPVSHGAPRA